MPRQTLKKHLINIRGARMKGKFVVFESDDWGAIRTPNKRVRKELMDQGLIKRNDPFAQLDTLETTEDYQALFDVLKKFKDKNGNNPILTANFILNNPDFKKIEDFNFDSYFSEPFYSTYQRYPRSESAFKVFWEGMEQKIIVPQFHGREHLNVVRWMNYLKSHNQKFHYAFDRECFAILPNSPQDGNDHILATYDYRNEFELNYIKKSVSDGLKQFEKIFGFKSKTAIAPCYVWDEEIEEILIVEGVRGIQSSYLQKMPLHNKPFGKTYPYLGKRNKFGQQYLMRNALFEPALNTNVDWINKCLQSISIAFNWGKPAIISMHRINFCGRMDENRRNENLKDFEILISKMIKRWPDIQFLSSADLLEKL